MAGPYSFKKDGQSDDGREMTRFLNDGNRPNALASGKYRIASGTAVSPGSLGVLPQNAQIIPFDSGYVLIIP